MTLAYFDCFAGAGGDMIVASLIDAGCDFRELSAELARLPVKGFWLRAEKVNRAGITATQFFVDVEPGEKPHRHLHHILEMIDGAGLPSRATERAGHVFGRLAKAEAKVHGCGIEKVHFHEVGAIDSICDVVGACLAMEMLGIDRIVCSAIPTGSGTVRGDHGLMPVPAPATAELLAGFPICGSDIAGEATTPTAAAIFTSLAESFGAAPAMDLKAVGYGGGTRNPDDRPNVLRVLLGEASAGPESDAVVELAANLDDCTGEVLGEAIEALLAGGAMDAWACPATMKKSRPGWVLSALAAEADADAVEALLFAHTTTFGVRRCRHQRAKLNREHSIVETPYGPVRVKVGRRGAAVVTASPEYEDCLRAARSHHTAVREVLAAAVEAWRKGNP